MHGAVKVYGRESVAVGVDDVSNVGSIGDARGAFVMDNDVVVLGPLRILVDFEDGLDGLGFVIGHFNGYVEAGFEAFLQNFLLVSVVVAATASDDEDADRLLLGSGKRGNQAGEERQREEGTG